MGKCPRCPWTGSARAYQKHFASKHYRKKKGKKQGKKGPRDKFKVPYGKDLLDIGHR
jgi:hypothetical protein